MTVFTCEWNYEAMLSCIYEAWASKKGHQNIRLELEPVGQFNMFDEYIHVDCDSHKAEMVENSTAQKISVQFCREVFRALLSYHPDGLDNVYRMLLLGFKYGASALDMMQYEAVSRNMKIRKEYAREVYRFQEFARFNQVKGDLYIAHIEPKSRIVQALGPIFMDRMPSENFMVIDDSHLEAVIHPKNQGYYMRILSENELKALLKTENNNDEYTDLWKVFFETIGIKERENRNYQMNNFPVWSRKHAVEFME